MCHYTTLCNVSVLRITIKNKTTFPTLFKKLTTETTCSLSQLLSKNYISQFSHQIFNVFALLLDDASKPVTPLTDGAINQTESLRQFAPLSDNGFLQLFDCRESSTLICHLLKNFPNSISHNLPDLSLGCLGAICQARSTLIMQLVSGVAGLSASSDISRSSIATHLRCGRIYSNSFISNCLLILKVKEFWKSVNIWLKLWGVQ